MKKQNEKKFMIDIVRQVDQSFTRLSQMTQRRYKLSTYAHRQIRNLISKANGIHRMLGWKTSNFHSVITRVKS